MISTTIRLNKSVHHKLKDIAINSNKTMNDVIDEMIEDYKKNKFWDKVDSDFEKLKSNEKLWQEELEERKLWENTLLDSDE